MERDQAMKFMHDLLRLMVQKKGSDLFITSGFPPAFKIDSKMTPVSNQALTPQHTSDLCRAIMNDKQSAEFESTKECNFAISPAGMKVGACPTPGTSTTFGRGPRPAISAAVSTVSRSECAPRTTRVRAAMRSYSAQVAASAAAADSGVTLRNGTAIAGS